jgi:polysaccharide export outer membrane protein
VSVIGLSVPDTGNLIRSLLAADYFVDPLVTVSMESSSNRPVMIFGEVRSPGAYEISAGQHHTILQVIARAGGFTDIAARDKVRIVRLADGKEQTIIVRVTDLLRGKNGVTDVDLRPGDIITVPETIF